MASKKTSKSTKRDGKTARKTESKPRAASTNRSTNAYAYSDRVPIIADTLRVDFDGKATVAELFGVLNTRGAGEFDTERRVAATVRYDKRENGDQSVLVRDGSAVALRSKRAVKSHQSARTEFRKSHKPAKNGKRSDS